jgi:autotransporter-associated beta strand protein
MSFANRPIEILNNARIDNDSTTGTSATMTFAQNLIATIGNNARSLTLSGVNTGDNIFGGNISNSATGSGAVSVIKQEAGKWILGGNNTYSGATTVSAGLLEIGGSGKLGGGTYNANISIASTSSGTLKFNSSAAQTLGGVISGAGTLVKDNDGVLNLTNTNDYTGATTVDGGTLLINGSTSSTSLVTVNNGGTLGGTGIIGGAVVLNDGAFLSPGASIESLASGSNTWNGGSTLIFEFSTDASTGSAGTQWDLLTITGGLDLSGASSTNQIGLNLITMLNATSTGALATWDPDSNALWSGFVTTTTGITGFAANLFEIDTAGFQNSLNGSFSVALNGNNLDLVYTAIPEPRAALLGGLGVLMLLRRRR